MQRHVCGKLRRNVPVPDGGRDPGALLDHVTRRVVVRSVVVDDVLVDPVVVVAVVVVVWRRTPSDGRAVSCAGHVNARWGSRRTFAKRKNADQE